MQAETDPNNHTGNELLVKPAASSASQSEAEDQDMEKRMKTENPHEDKKKHKHHSHHKKHKDHASEKDKSSHKHHSHRHSHRSRSRSRSESESSSRSRSVHKKHKRNHQSHSHSKERKRNEKEERSGSKTGTANDVPFANPSLPNRVPKSIFTEADKHDQNVSAVPSTFFSFEEKAESKPTIQILLSQTIIALDQGQAIKTPSQNPKQPVINEEKGKGSELKLERRNSQEEIDRRQSYFRMVEREREQCEAKFNLHDASPIRDAPDMKLSVPRVPWDDSCGFYKVKVGDTIQHYKIVSTIGKGVFGSVIKCVDTNTQKEVAMKIIRAKDVYMASGEKEFNVLRALNEADPYDTKNIVRLVDGFTHQGHLCIVMEHLETNMRESYPKFAKGAPVSLNTIQLYAQQLLKALHFLRKHNVVHADIKPDNILVARDGKRLKLCDFGSALYSHEIGVTEYVASRYYRAPEIILGCQFDAQIDVWSLGATLFEAYTGKILFPGISNNDMLRLMLKMRGKLGPWMLKKGEFSRKHFNEKGVFVQAKEDVSVSSKAGARQGVEDLMATLKAVNPHADPTTLVLFKDFLQKTLAMDPCERITPEEALGHPFVGLRAKPKIQATNK